MAEDQLIPTFTMTRDPRLRKLFAAIGVYLDEGDTVDVESTLYNVMLDLAPEFLPPDSTDDKKYRTEWRTLVERALHG